MTSDAPSTVVIDNTSRIRVLTPNDSLCVVTSSETEQGALAFTLGSVLNFVTGDSEFYSCIQQVSNQVIEVTQNSANPISAKILAGDDYFGMYEISAGVLRNLTSVSAAVAAQVTGLASSRLILQVTASSTQNAHMRVFDKQGTLGETELSGTSVVM